MITQKFIQEVLEYDPLTGVFYWKASSSSRIKPGDLAGTTRPDGHRQIRFKTGCFLEHRLAFLYMTGEMPEFVDHINGIKDDNRWENLRPATKQQNQYNHKINSSNTSGVKGVSWMKANSKWRARIRINGRDSHLGYFPDMIGAELAVRKAREKYHGEFANHG